MKGQRLERIPAALVAPCGECGVPVRRTSLREFNERDLCEHCFQALIAAAEGVMRRMVIELNEPDRVCSQCAAMVDPAVSSSWCAVLELGDSRAALCQSFSPLAAYASAPAVSALRSASPDHQQLWAQVCSELEATLGPTHLTWLASAQPLAFDGKTLSVEVPDEYTRSWLVARLMPAILQALESIGYSNVHVDFKPGKTSSASRSSAQRSAREESQSVVIQPVLQIAPPPIAAPESLRPHQSGGFNPSFSFDQFVVGTGNRLAHAGALAVADGDSAYNPLFLYGGVGVGKTHLLQAIGGRCIERGRRALYVASETFTNELISAIRNGSTSEFRQRYREIDVLLIDDIHFIIGKESTQEEFFHTFNWLYDNGKQIVLSSDRAPNRMHVLDARLRSRFWWGLTADIQAPDFETRIEILKRKATLRGRTLPEPVLAFLAERATDNVRELEGLLNRLIAMSDLHGVEPSVALASGLFNGRDRGRELDYNDVLQAVSAYFKISSAAMTSKGRGRDVSTPRHIAMYLMRFDIRLSLPHIGDVLGGRDHSSVSYACSRIGREMAGQSRIKQDVEAIRGLLFQA